MPHRGQIVYHFHKEWVTHLDHCIVTPEATLLWNVKLTSAQDELSLSVSATPRHLPLVLLFTYIVIARTNGEEGF
ncbi:hypothetical protein VNO78_16919 [Psophocarpus tetragonolobus]|uniref:Uncharacterized protein n=1 Tax=Psophocarpus tetragonolobus TaxID=3891 RepID=A0AAN9SGE1_PSOTE